ncbi:hypothetical protein [uncultured Oscillibacter sp.]|uniref:hypothetical protein n=1 Tax=uncultured Oscillibacter sp. TaxID=876091 RepID=UPI0025D05629|nr:hypothetical protein [uncultured Oscillibacter sp.]
MRKNALRFFFCFLALIVLSLSVFPAQAVDTEYTSVESFWNWVAGSGDIAQGILSHVPIGSRDNVCAKSDDGYHHSNGFTKDGGDGYFLCVCRDCGREFKGYASDLPAAYNDYVTTLPATGYTSDGAILWSPEISYVYTFWNSYRRYCPHYSGSYDKLDDGYISVFDCANKTILLRPVAGSNSFTHRYAQAGFSGKYPIDGYYRLTKSLASNSTVIGGSTSKSYSLFYEAESKATLYYAGVSYDFSKRVVDGSSNSIQHASYSYYPPVYEVVPFDSGIGQVNNTYNTTTRPTSISGGALGIADVDANGQLTGSYTKVEDNSTIINETNNTYYNPATGVTVPITNWSYDYSDRSYRVDYTTSNTTGDTVTNTSTITYGDEYITIQEIDNSKGDTITNNYTIYYLIDGSGSGEVCAHDWTETDTTPATCTLPGSKLFTCSKCQKPRTDPIPALGHDWKVKQTVATEYDDTGQLVQKGYTIFECSRCHEQYKSEDGTSPPDTPPEDPGEEEEKKGFFAWLWSVLTDAVKKLIEGIIDAILKTLDFFFGGDSQSNYDFYNSPSTFSGVSVWAS